MLLPFCCKNKLQHGMHRMKQHYCNIACLQKLFYKSIPSTIRRTNFFYIKLSQKYVFICFHYLSYLFFKTSHMWVKFAKVRYRQVPLMLHITCRKHWNFHVDCGCNVSKYLDQVIIYNVFRSAFVYRNICLKLLKLRIMFSF